jgi:PAP_fibrillin
MRTSFFTGGLPYVVAAVLLASVVYAFQVPVNVQLKRQTLGSQSPLTQLREQLNSVIEPETLPEIDSTNELSARDSMVMKLKQELIDLGQRTDRGFRASRLEREQARSIMFDLAQYTSVREPAALYYEENRSPDHNSETTPSLLGKWTLIYTDAPDITGLGQPSPFVELGRIGQDNTEPPLIKNVIEWLSPSWATNIPFLVGQSNDSARVLQKVVTTGSAVPESPTVVDLSVAGIQLTTTKTPSAEAASSDSKSVSLRESIAQEGLIVGLLQRQQQEKNSNAVDLLRLEKSQQPPFGSFEILYLDDDFRITKTSQNHFAVNVRVQPGEEWF